MGVRYGKELMWKYMTALQPGLNKVVEVVGYGNASIDSLASNLMRQLRLGRMYHAPTLVPGPLSARFFFVGLAESLIDGGSEVETVR